jgi:hypothetical protein
MTGGMRGRRRLDAETVVAPPVVRGFGRLWAALAVLMAASGVLAMRIGF